MRQFFFWFFLVSLIVFRYVVTRPVYQNGDMIRISGTVFSDPVNYKTSQSLKVGGLRVYLPVFPEIYYGDKIVVEGIVDGKSLTKAKLISVESSKGLMSTFRNNIIAFYQKVLPQPMSGLTAGITLGSKGEISSGFWEKVKSTGVAHIVVASGTNVAFVVSFLMGVLTLFLSRRKAIFYSLGGILIYLFISGFDAPLVRASVMAGMAFWSEKTGRLLNSWRNLSLTGATMLIIQPDWALDLGFALSFVSTASIMLFERKIALRLKAIPGVLREGLSTSLSAQIGVAPIIFVSFGQFNPLSPVINALVLWTIPLIMILGAIGGVVGLILPFLGKIILWLSFPLSWYFVQVIELFS